MANQIVIEPQKGWLRINFRELFEYRELIFFLAWRDIMAQYKQAVFGVGWAVVKPVFSVLVYTLVFGKVARLSSSGIPYSLFTLCGLVAWSFFAAALGQSTVSLLSNTSLLTKAYFPRLVIPLASLGRGAVDFIISFILLVILMGIYGFAPLKTMILFPIFLAMGLSLTLGTGLFVSAISVKYHDLMHAIPFLIQIWFWVTPVAYGVENIPLVNWKIMLITGLFSIVVLFGGLFYFRRMESEFADVI